MIIWKCLAIVTDSNSEMLISYDSYSKMNYSILCVTCEA